MQGSLCPAADVVTSYSYRCLEPMRRIVVGLSVSQLHVDIELSSDGEEIPDLGMIPSHASENTADIITDDPVNTVDTTPDVQPLANTADITPDNQDSGDNILKHFG